MAKRKKKTSKNTSGGASRADRSAKKATARSVSEGRPRGAGVGPPPGSAPSTDGGAAIRSEASEARQAGSPPEPSAFAASANPTPAAPAQPLRVSRISDDDVFLFNEGTHYRLHEHLGAHLDTREGQDGVAFGVWAPNARSVSVVGDFNGWNPDSHHMSPRGGSGIWECFIPGLGEGTVYKFHVASHHRGYSVNKADPFGFMHEMPPQTASVVRGLDYTWGDDAWMRTRGETSGLDKPMSIYEAHVGSWMHAEDEHRSLNYRELAPRLAEYVREHGFTHVEFLPVMEHPFYQSWGYQTTGYFAPTSRFGTPQDFMYLVDYLHQAGVGVILDWVPSHFPSDEHSLGYFDGTHLYEHEDPRQGFHPDWKSLIFNYGRNEVRAFLISSAVFWLEKYHIDGLRVDAVASMLYLDYSRREGEWIPNQFGGRENVEAIDFLRQFNSEVYRSFPDIHTIAEESTAWPNVSRPTYVGGLGFGYKWDMGWMHDTLQYMSRDSIHRRFHQNEITFRAIYQFSENYVMPISHDEVVHGKGSLINKMAGDEWRQFANLRLLLANQWLNPGKKLLFMGSEFAQRSEWSQDRGLDWHLTQHDSHSGIQRLVKELNRIYRNTPALHERDADPEGFRWVDGSDADNSVLSFLRVGADPDDVALVILHHTPQPLHNYIVGAPFGGVWREVLNSDAREFGGSGVGNYGRVEANPVPMHGQPASVTLTLPPLAALVLTPDFDAENAPRG